MSSDPAPARPQFYGGRICLDFANTIDWRTSPTPRELMPDYRAFIAWSVARKTLTSPAADALLATAAQAPAEAEAILRAAHDLRAAILHACEAAERRTPMSLDAINRQIAAAPAQPGLISQSGACFHDLPGARLEEPLWPVLWSVTALLASDDLARVRCCDARGCGWFFVDESPNRTRLWCSNSGCGNRERARRAYAKARSPQFQPKSDAH